MIHVIISPAKQMESRADCFEPRGIPPFPLETERLVRALRDLEAERGPQGLQDLWGVSDKLLAENLERLHAFTHVPTAEQLACPEVSRRVGPALFSYIGIQYRSIAAEVLDEGSLAWLQEHLRILSALYGCVRPFDAVQPYRLEMGARLAVDGAANLYAFWGDRIARAICGDLDPDDPAELVNLASAEYAKAVIPRLPADARVTTCVFSSSLRNGKPVQRSTESKTARGSMVRWMAEHRIERADQLAGFDVGFAYAPELSTPERPRRTLVFMRD